MTGPPAVCGVERRASCQTDPAAQYRRLHYRALRLPSPSSRRSSSELPAQVLEHVPHCASAHSPRCRADILRRSRLHRKSRQDHLSRQNQSATRAVHSTAHSTESSQAIEVGRRGCDHRGFSGSIWVRIIRIIQSETVCGVLCRALRAGPVIIGELVWRQRCRRPRARLPRLRIGVRRDCSRRARPTGRGWYSMRHRLASRGNEFVKGGHRQKWRWPHNSFRGHLATNGRALCELCRPDRPT